MKYWLGIDPGMKGSICILPESRDPIFIDNSTNVIDAVAIIKSYPIHMAMIEDVHSIFGVSAKSNFNFGFNTGYLHGIITSLGIPLDLVQPKALYAKFKHP